MSGLLDQPFYGWGEMRNLKSEPASAGLPLLEARLSALMWLWV